MRRVNPGSVWWLTQSMFLYIHQKSSSGSGSAGLSQLTWRDSWFCQNHRPSRRLKRASKPCDRRGGVAQVKRIRRHRRRSSDGGAEAQQEILRGAHGDMTGVVALGGRGAGGCDGREGAGAEQHIRRVVRVPGTSTIRLDWITVTGIMYSRAVAASQRELLPRLASRAALSSQLRGARGRQAQGETREIWSK